MLASGSHLKCTEIDKPKSANGGNGERDTVGPLSGDFGVWRVAAAMVEAQEQDDQDDLIEELTPALHQEGAGNLAPSV